MLLPDIPSESSQDDFLLDKTFVESTSTNSTGPIFRAGTAPLSISDSEMLGSGKVVGMLGYGGMAQVYKIWNEKLEVYRAVKIIKNSSITLLRRFQTESKITAQLNHSGIVKIYDVGTWYGLPYIEMEYIEGITLEQLINTHSRLSFTISCAIGIQIARILQYAHNEQIDLYNASYKGIIHRDLKPANIMLSNSGEIKVLDFGIARPVEASLHTKTEKLIEL